MAGAKLLGRLAWDLAVWLIPAGVFLAFYVGAFDLPATAVLPHLLLVATLWIALAAVRTIAGVLLGRGLAFWVSSLALALALAALLLYYALVILGLTSWGRVITWDLMRTYAQQLPALGDALGLSVGYVLAALALTFGAVLGATRAYLRRFDWVPLLRQHISRSMLAFACCGALGIVGVQAYAFTNHAMPAGEPLSMTVYPWAANRRVQKHSMDLAQSQIRDRAEDAVRASYGPTATAVRRNVVLIVVDALRSDHLGLFGYQRDTTPNLAAIVRGARDASLLVLHASCAESTCGLTSIAASRYVHQFSERPITLPEVLKRNGYSTHFILSGDHTNFYGLRDAYGKVDTYFDGSMSREYYMNDDRLVLDRVASLPPWNGEPTMLQFHLMSVHELGHRRDEFRVFTPAANYKVLTNQEATGGRPSERAVNHYDNGVRQVDAVIAELLRSLADKGYLADALVAITGDHGELLGEHDMYSHGRSVHEEVLRVPLILLSYGHQRKGHIAARLPGAQVDIAPTILAELGIAQPSTWVGTALQEGGRADFTYFQEAPFAGLYDHRDPEHLWKFYLDSRTGKTTIADVGREVAARNDVVGGEPPAQAREWWALVLPTVVSGTSSRQ
jgi:glucan phosphoethanolaminetransferase (alkaline phosphatase superfamily)